MLKDDKGYVTIKKTGKIVYEGSLQACIQIAMDNDDLIVHRRKPQKDTGAIIR